MNKTINSHLHILSSSTVPRAVLACSEQDQILLIREAVYLLLNWPKNLHKHQVLALEDDLLARGINISKTSNIKLINYEQFVDLVFAHKANTSW